MLDVQGFPPYLYVHLSLIWRLNIQNVAYRYHAISDITGSSDIRFSAVAVRTEHLAVLCNRLSALAPRGDMVSLHFFTRLPENGQGASPPDG